MTGVESTDGHPSERRARQAILVLTTVVGLVTVGATLLAGWRGVVPLAAGIATGLGFFWAIRLLYRRRHPVSSEEVRFLGGTRWKDRGGSLTLVVRRDELSIQTSGAGETLARRAVELVVVARRWFVVPFVRVRISVSGRTVDLNVLSTATEFRNALTSLGYEVAA